MKKLIKTTNLLDHHKRNEEFLHRKERKKKQNEKSFKKYSNDNKTVELFFKQKKSFLY